MCVYIYIYIYIYICQTCHFRKRATSVPAEGPAYGLDFARHCEFPLRKVACSRKSHVWCRLIESRRQNTHTNQT